ncbi:MAG TPA: ectonucleotide pyrophosphatase/phosphodiesterase [Candidatus Bathyarchaeia archaeon]|nr:ectonucleotide pyrophosphatase/phosphodiesterase [Candidatus Bathyarchaeia archaeon]
MIPDRLRPWLAAVFVLLAVLLLAGQAGAQQPVQSPLLLMISIDGLRPDYVTAADAHGAKVPNLRRFLTDGTFAEGVQGVIPTVTYPSHTTLITGVWPTRHGILNNTTFDPQRQNQGGWYWYTEDIRVPTLWDAAARAGLSTASVQWPVSVGARVTWNIPEFWRAGTPDDAKLLRAVSTPGLLAELEAELGPYPRTLTAESDEQRARFAARILEKKRPNVLTLHLIALDHVEHETGPFSPESIAVLERLDAAVGMLRQTAETLAPGRAYVAIVSDHGFTRTTQQLDLFVEFRKEGLFTVDGNRITDWKAMPWTAGGSIAVMLKDPEDQATLAKVNAIVARLAADPANGIDRVLDATALDERGGFPGAALLIGLKPEWYASSSLSGPTVSAGTVAGQHGYLPDLPDLRASFFVVGPGVPAGRSLGVIDMRDIATTLARRLDLALPSAQGKDLWP